MQSICEDKMCAGCMACVDACPKDAIAVLERREYYTPSIDQSKCIDCGRCTAVCQQCNPPQGSKPSKWLQGWDSNSESRGTSSSGGLAAAIIRGFISAEGVVCSCCFRDGQFGFEFSSSIADAVKYKGSKYVKSNPIGSYARIKKLLVEGKEVLFVGLPCQVASLKNFVGNNLLSSLYTVDLICHGTPSPAILCQFLSENGIDMNQLESIEFRSKGSFQLRENERTIDLPGVLDGYTVAFLAGLDYTENCYHCRYASIERVSDVTLGDSWGTNLTEEMRRGVSLVLIQNQKGQRLIDLAGAELMTVDIETAIKNNGQLRSPSEKPSARARFFEDLSCGRSITDAVRRSLPKRYFKQSLKRLLIRIGLLKRGGGYGIKVSLAPDSNPLHYIKGSIQ